MKLNEYQAKEILRRDGILTPKGVVGNRADELLASSEDLGFPLVIKAQIHVGGRGKAGAIRVVSGHEELRKGIKDILSMTVKGLKVKILLIEKALIIDRQFYLGITVDRSRQGNLIMLSCEGGIDIEDTARDHPERIKRLTVKGSDRLDDQSVQELLCFMKVDGSLNAQVASLLRSLFAVYITTDAQLVEINPLVLTKDGKLVACDAKMIIDDNALFRHPDLDILKEEDEDSVLERDAHRAGLAYVKLSGNIGIIGNGAGLVMATMDEVKRVGGKPANFLDIGGGAKKDVMERALGVIYRDAEAEGIFINIFGGITRCDEVALGIIEVLKAAPRNIPIVLRLTGTQCEEGKRILGKSNLITAESMEDGAKKITALVNNK